MYTFLVVDKSGNMKSSQMKTITIDNLYKRCGFKKLDDFGCKCEWQLDIDTDKTTYCSIWGRENGKSNMVNKFELPPPIDKKLLFGSFIILYSTTSLKNTNTDDDWVKHSSDILSINIEKWDQIFNHLYGGFEDIDNSDTTSDEDNDDNLESDIEYTNDGYIKDGFVVDDNDSELEEEEYIPVDEK